MARPSKKKNVRDQLEARIDQLTTQTEDLRQQVVDRAPGVRDQLVELLPDKDQLLGLRDDLFERLPDQVTDKLPEKVKPKRSRLKRIAIIGLITGAGAAAFAVLRGRSATPAPDPTFPPAPAPTATAGDTSPDAATAPGTTAATS